ncbi:hypothetical protein [Synechococcus sp. CC9616]|uniref:hypothetical protein n=1 Tax=Synechococcus sp. CC9616 TaxID=110663 RepID=UPI0004B96D5B|nr:hypothetical protein [Synechococcus sp. CC9616]
MTNSICFKLHAIDLKQTSGRRNVQQALSDQKELVFHSSDGTSLSKSNLLQTLNAFDNEDECADLSLAELEQLTGGVGLPEALVSSTILMTMVAGTSGLFTNGVNAIGTSSIQDAINSGIRADIESIRHDLSNHNLDAATGTYRPNAEAGEIGQEFIDSLDLQDLNEREVGIQTQEDFGGENVIRTIKADGDSITVTYSHSGTTVQNTSMVMPASGWLS